jgi:hypothetical protein
MVSSYGAGLEGSLERGPRFAIGWRPSGYPRYAAAGFLLRSGATRVREQKRPKSKTLAAREPRVTGTFPTSTMNRPHPVATTGHVRSVWQMLRAFLLSIGLSVVATSAWAATDLETCRDNQESHQPPAATIYLRLIAGTGGFLFCGGEMTRSSW